MKKKYYIPFAVALLVAYGLIFLSKHEILQLKSMVFIELALFLVSLSLIYATVKDAKALRQKGKEVEIWRMVLSILLGGYCLFELVATACTEFL